MNYRLLITTFSCVIMVLQLQSAQMSDADLAKLTRVAPPGGLVVPSEDEEKQNAVKQKQDAATEKLIDAIEGFSKGRSLDEAINAIRQALNEGPDLHKKNSNEETPLILAAEKNYTSEGSVIIDMLIQAGSDVNTRGLNQSTPLMLAAGSGNKNVVKRLLNTEGIDVKLKDCTGETALDLAKDAANRYLEYAKDWAKAAKEYDQIPVDENGNSEFNLGPAINVFRKSKDFGTKKYFKQQSQGNYRAHFNAVKIIKMLEKRAS